MQLREKPLATARSPHDGGEPDAYVWGRNSGLVSRAPSTSAHTTRAGNSSECMMITEPGAVASTFARGFSTTVASGSLATAHDLSL